jgi:AraC-like DNA-binding protein
LGYTDPSHFSRAFRRWEGVCPRTYQKSFKAARDGQKKHATPSGYDSRDDR